MEIRAQGELDVTLNDLLIEIGTQHMEIKKLNEMVARRDARIVELTPVEEVDALELSEE